MRWYRHSVLKIMHFTIKLHACSKSLRAGVLAVCVFSNPIMAEAPSRYSGFEYHNTDLQISRSTTLDKDDNRTNKTQYTLITNTDIAWMNGNIALHGNREDGLSHSHIRFDQYQLNNEKLNGYVNHIAVGDLTPQGLELTRKNRGRGFLISNQNSSPSSSINQQSIEGNGLPNWQVELYSNGLLLDTYQIGPDGRYQFNDLNVFLGKNIYVLKWTAPNGSQYSETKTIYKGSDITKAGKAAYRFSVIQPNLSSVNSTDPSTNPQSSNNQVNLHWAYQLTSSISFDMGAQHTDINDKSHNNVQVGVQTRLDKTTLAVTANKPNKTKTRVRYDIGRQAGKTRFLFNYTSAFTPSFIHSLTTEDNLNQASKDESLYHLDIYRIIKQTPARLTLDHFKSDERKYQQYQLHLSGYQKIADNKFNWFNRFAYTRMNTLTNTSNSTLSEKNSSDWAGELSTRFITPQYHSNLTLDYQLKPNTRLNKARFSHYLTLSPTTKTYFNATHQFASNQSEYTLGVSWQNSYLRITPEFSYASGDIKSGKITFNTNLYKDGLYNNKQNPRKTYQLKPHNYIDKENQYTSEETQ